MHLAPFIRGTTSSPLGAMGCVLAGKAPPAWHTHVLLRALVCRMPPCTSFLKVLPIWWNNDTVDSVNTRLLDAEQ